MRRILLASTLALLLIAVPFAAARGHADDDDDKETEHANEHAGLANKTHEPRNETSDKANRTADRVAFHLFMDSWHENATAVRDACHDVDHANMTDQQRDDARHCVRDGYRAWWSAHMDEIQALFWAFKGHGHRGHHG